MVIKSIMFVKHLQEYLEQFTVIRGKKTTGIGNARIYMQVGHHLEEINKKHQELNGELRKELQDVREALARVS